MSDPTVGDLVKAIASVLSDDDPTVRYIVWLNEAVKARRLGEAIKEAGLDVSPGPGYERRLNAAWMAKFAVGAPGTEAG